MAFIVRHPQSVVFPLCGGLLTSTWDIWSCLQAPFLFVYRLFALSSHSTISILSSLFTLSSALQHFHHFHQHLHQGVISLSWILTNRSSSTFLASHYLLGNLFVTFCFSLPQQFLLLPLLLVLLAILEELGVSFSLQRK